MKLGISLDMGWVPHGSGVDSIADAFFTQQAILGQTLTPTEKTAINNYCAYLRKNGLLPFLTASKTRIYPCVGGTAISCGVDLITPTNSIFWDNVGNGTFNANGVTSLSNLQGQTGLYADAVDPNDFSMWMYIRNNVDGLGREIYANLVGSGAGVGIFPNLGGTAYFDCSDTTARVTASVSGSLGFYMGSRISSSDFKAYIDGVQVATSSGGSFTAEHAQFLFFNQTFGSTRNIAMWGICQGLNAAKQLLMKTANLAFQTALGRAILLALIFLGDSIPRGYGLAIPATQCFPAQTLALMNPQAYYTNTAVDATTIADAQAAISTEVTPFIKPGFVNVCIPFIGTNDLFFGATGAATFSAYVTYCQSLRGVGANKIVACKILPRDESGQPPGYDTERLAFNAAIDEDTTHFDAKFDAPSVLPDPDNLTDYQVGGTHPTSTGAGKLAVALQPILNSII